MLLDQFVLTAEGRPAHESERSPMISTKSIYSPFRNCVARSDWNNCAEPISRP